jgi:PAS domain S-box-containing protein
VFQVQYAFVTECADETTRNLRILAFWTGDGFADSITYNVHGTPCENVVSGQICSYPERLQSLFPLEKELVTLNAEGYLGAPLYDRDGHIVGHLAVIDTKPLYPKPYDISILKIFAARAAAELKRKRAEEALMASEKRFRALFESAPIGVSINNPQGTFVQVNKSLQEMIGFTEEELQQVNFGAITHAEDIAQSKQLFVEMVQGERKGFQVEKRYVKKNGDVMWASTNCAAIWDEGGIFVYTFAMVEDITKRKQAEQALREAMAKVEELKNRLQAENVYLQEEIRTHHNFEEIIGSSPAMRKVFQSVEKVAVTDTTVLITGETGTGKELVARAIHNLSPRKDRPLITVNCAALPAGLIESELFGHEKGAFTGAVARKKGRFELADGGTLFLDEVGELPLETQAKLLRVLQEHSFERVGGTQPLKVNVRVLAATNRDLQEQVNHGAFRADLFYRLNIFPIPLPSLRERGEDISLLTNYFVARFARRMGKKIDRVSHGALERLMRYPWPGNIRELANLIERAVILCDGGMLQPDHLGLTEHIPTAVASEIAQVATLQETERDHILKTLEKTNWIVGGPAGAAQLLGLNRTTLLARMKKLGIEKPTAR